MPGTLHIANLSVTVDEHDLQQLFAAYGSVRHVEVTTDLRAGCSTGSGMVEMESDEQGDVAIAELNGRAYRGYLLTVGWATSRQLTDADSASLFEPMNTPDQAQAHDGPGPTPAAIGQQVVRHRRQ